MKNIFENVRRKKPLVHNITNYVTAADCANIILACGGSPIMADSADEAAQITALCGALNINIGTPRKSAVLSMLLSGKKANELHRPVVFDPVGAGASDFRTETAMRLLGEIEFSVIRGNISEIKALACGSGTTKGVDADVSDEVTEDNLQSAVDFAKMFSAKTGAVIAVTGAIDIVADKNAAYCIRNGTPMMARVTGVGCRLSAMTAAFLAANSDNITKAAAAAVCAMGLAGEIARSRLGADGGNASYGIFITDAVYNMTADMLEKGAKYEMR